MNKKVIFDENGEVVLESKELTNNLPSNEHKFKKKSMNVRNQRKSNNVESPIVNKVDANNESDEKWFEKYAEFNNGDIVELNEHEVAELTKICKTKYDAALPRLVKNNPNDAKWLETALYKGTAKDKPNAGALLVYSNPLANLSALQTLIGYCKHSNKVNTDVISVVCELFIEALLPLDRKLISLPLRGAGWKALRKRDDITDDMKGQIYVYWYFENELKEHYFEYLRHLQYGLQTNQDAHKSIAIASATKLLMHSPEKEQMLLSMLINKLGDPSNKIASKVLHHLTELIYKHPNMCGVITNETEKLLFRNNITEKAQHFALSYLSQIAPYAHSEICTKLVNICFSYFKILVQKGTINNKMMQAILRCLQKSIINVKYIKEVNNGEIMTKDMQDTIYRLVHLADIKISIQTLSLLLQLITMKNENSDRYYNAFYKKLFDLNLTTIGNSSSAQFLHILHRSIHIDQKISRALAFIKRLLQITLYMPSQIACGILIVINKLLKTRPELLKFELIAKEQQQSLIIKNEEELDKFDSDGEEKYEDVNLDDNKDNVKVENESNENLIEGIIPTASWHHTKILNIKTENKTKEKISQIAPTNYNPYHRVPAFAGAEYSIKSELVLLLVHYHPTVRVFAESILNHKKISYHGDPLKDFALTHFLERFSFKNPKKINDKNSDSVAHVLHNKSYVPYGTRGEPIKSLTKDNCMEDELFIFNYLEKKRENQAKLLKSKEKNDDENEIEDVDDDEFEEYLDSLCKKVKKTSNNDKGDDDMDLDYLKELGDDIEGSRNEKKKKKKNNDGDDEESDVAEKDWTDDDEDFGSSDDNIDENENEEEDIESDSNISASMNESDNDSIPELEDGNIDENSSDGDEEDASENGFEDECEGSEEGYEPKQKKSKKSTQNFNKTLKNQTDMSSLFTAVDDFAELLEDTSKTKGHGTFNAIFNKDKSSDKQLKWEEKRRLGIKKFHVDNRFKKFGKSKKK